MKMTIEPTGGTATLDREGGIQVRIWKGVTESGTPVHAFIALVAAPSDQDAPELQAALAPRPAPAIADPAPAQHSPPGVDLGSGGAVFAGDPRAQAARPVCAMVESLANTVAAQSGWGSVLDALASVYLDELVRHAGPEHAAAALDSLRRLIPTIDAAHRNPGLGAAPVAGRA